MSLAFESHASNGREPRFIALASSFDRAEMAPLFGLRKGVRNPIISVDKALAEDVGVYGGTLWFRGNAVADGKRDR
jgi:hypothetical protein